jgi:hypothetical protein
MKESFEALADRIEDAKPGWLPISGHVVNITFSLEEREMIVRALREAALPTMAETLART